MRCRVGCIVCPALLLLCACTPVKWTKQDTARELAFASIIAVDARQTADIRNHDDLVEKGPIARKFLDENPENVEVYFAGLGLLHYGISRSLKPGPRRTFQYLTILLNGGVVVNNWRIGLRVK